MIRKGELTALATYFSWYATYNIFKNSETMVCSQALANRCSGVEMKSEGVLIRLIGG